MRATVLEAIPNRASAMLRTRRQRLARRQSSETAKKPPRGGFGRPRPAMKAGAPDSAACRRPCSACWSPARVGALGDAGRLSAAVAQVIELGATDLAAADDLDRIDQRRVDREDALDALAVGDLADREGLVQPAAGARDADALVGLDAGALAFDHLHVDHDGVAGLEIRDGLAERGDLLALELFDDVHDGSTSGWRAATAAR